MVDLKRGQFIDTYRGEVITDAEATRREQVALTGSKASYLYSLDKHVGDEGIERDNCFVVDGEMMGGPTRFINHSCSPNVAQYTVSYNKHDSYVYDLAFFAFEDIPAMTELTFDYVDKEGEDDPDEEAEELPSASQDTSVNHQKPLECRCGSKNCRKVLCKCHGQSEFASCLVATEGFDFTN